MATGAGASIKLQPRDFELLRGLFESRLMTRQHIAALYFDGKREMAKKRLQKLGAAHLVRERPRRIGDAGVIFLTTKGFRELRAAGEFGRYPQITETAFEKRAQVSELTIRHELEVMDVKTALTTALEQTERFHVAEFSTWPRLYRFRACAPTGESASVEPDGFIRIRETTTDAVIEHTFFLEVDRSTEQLCDVAAQCHSYVDYYRSGGFAVRCNSQRDRYREHPFRVLVICKTKARRDNIASRLRESAPPIATQVLLTDYASVASSALGSIWVTPISYGTKNKFLRDGVTSYLIDSLLLDGSLGSATAAFR